MFRRDGSRAQKLENRWNCLDSFVRGCSYSLPEWQAVKLTFFAPCTHNDASQASRKSRYLVSGVLFCYFKRQIGASVNSLLHEEAILFGEGNQ